MISVNIALDVLHQYLKLRCSDIYSPELSIGEIKTGYLYINRPGINWLVFEALKELNPEGVSFLGEVMVRIKLGAFIHLLPNYLKTEFRFILYNLDCGVLNTVDYKKEWWLVL